HMRPAPTSTMSARAIWPATRPAIGPPRLVVAGDALLRGSEGSTRDARAAGRAPKVANTTDVATSTNPYTRHDRCGPSSTAPSVKYGGIAAATRSAPHHPATSPMAPAPAAMTAHSPSW